MGIFELLKRKEKKRFIGTCPTNMEKCYDPICCGGCAQLKVTQIFKKKNSTVEKFSY